MISKRGEMTWDEIFGVVLGAAAVLVMAILMFKLLAVGVDLNKEYAEGVYAKLEKAAAEAKDGKGEFSILDVPVDYGDSVFLVLFKGEDYVSLSNYPVEIRNSGFLTYIKRSAAGPVLAESGLGYYPLFREAGVSEGVAKEANEKVIKRVSEIALENADELLFEVDMEQVVKNFGTRIKRDNVDDIVEEVLLATRGKGLTPKGKDDILKGILGSYAPKGGIPNSKGTFDTVDSFLSSARGISKRSAWAKLRSEAAYNIQFQKIIGDSVSGDDAERMIKEMTDKTFGKVQAPDGKIRFLTPEEKIVEFKNILKGSVDDVDDAVKGIKKGLSSKEALKVALGSADDISDDAVKMAVDNIVSVKSISSDAVTEGVMKSNLKAAGVADDVVEKVVRSSKGKLTGLTFRAAGKLAGAAFVIWETYEYYTVAHTAQARVLTALNQKNVITNDWVSSKLLQVKKGDDDVLCVCYVDDDYRRNICSDCVSFDGKLITPKIEGENYWTFCEDVTLEDKGGGILLSSSTKEGCRHSIALTNDECERSRVVLVEELNSFKDRMVGSTVSIATAGVYGVLMGGIGGFIGGGVGLLFGGAGAVPGAVLGAQWGVALGVAAGGYAAYEGVDFSCDEQGHIYLGAVPE